MLKERLTATRPFPEVPIGRCPANELAYYRAGTVDGEWQGTVWPVHIETPSPELAQEFRAVINAFCREFPTLDSIREFCRDHAEKTRDTSAFHAYLDGVHGIFWFALFTREDDFNLYLHCLKK